MPRRSGARSALALISARARTRAQAPVGAGRLPGQCFLARARHVARHMILETPVDRCGFSRSPREHRRCRLRPHSSFLSGERATHSPAPRSTRHAALLLLAGTSPQRRRACRARPSLRLGPFALSKDAQASLEPRRSPLPDTPITAPASAFNCRFQDDAAGDDLRRIRPATLLPSQRIPAGAQRSGSRRYFTSRFGSHVPTDGATISSARTSSSSPRKGAAAR